ncbi:GGDEF domain-containing protein [Alicyclobacillus ferrooxydans]|uniref:GGDEF domain-containing protein n=1 Tax=Alicyclobacillus ferrooxydans TaxID=471514 RepID=A0A0P9CK31_9BACL|nr:GGDEF domain-containing protein [Alicyclobacillus ferrooxydans]KPV45639.1 hypothetical protein AN477_01625 [Alicyclobacillus ferrooxydans]
MHPYIVLIERLSSGASWEDAVTSFWIDMGAVKVERFVEGHLTAGKEFASSEVGSIRERDTLDVKLTTATYKLYLHKGTHLIDELNAIRFIKGLDWLLHDREFLYESAIHDALTGALNRRGLIEWFEQRRRSEGGFVLAFFDLDHFKELNDTKGHQQGDEALKEVTAALQKMLRSTDVVARLGGDEFVFIVDQTPCHPNIKTRLQGIIRQLPLKKYGLTLTVGTACFPAHGTELPQLISKADFGLYQGKAQGRNAIVLWEECHVDGSTKDLV